MLNKKNKNYVILYKYILKYYYINKNKTCVMYMLNIQYRFCTWQIDVHKECNVLADCQCHSVVENHFIGMSHWVVCKIHNDVF